MLQVTSPGTELPSSPPFGRSSNLRMRVATVNLDFGSQCKHAASTPGGYGADGRLCFSRDSNDVAVQGERPIDIRLVVPREELCGSSLGDRPVPPHRWNPD